MPRALDLVAANLSGCECSALMRTNTVPHGKVTGLIRSNQQLKRPEVKHVRLARFKPGQRNPKRLFQTGKFDVIGFGIRRDVIRIFNKAISALSEVGTPIADRNVFRILDQIHFFHSAVDVVVERLKDRMRNDIPLASHQAGKAKRQTMQVDHAKKSDGLVINAR